MCYARIMKRTTVVLPEATLARLRHEARRREVSLGEVVREAVEAYVPPVEPGAPLAFFAAGTAAAPDDSERVDERVGAAMRRRAARRG